MTPLDRARASERRDLGAVHEEPHRLAVERAGQMHPAAQRQRLGRDEMVAPCGLRHLEAGFAFEHPQPVARILAAAEHAIHDPAVVLPRHIGLHPAVDRDRLGHREARIVRHHDHAPGALDGTAHDARHPRHAEQFTAQPVPRRVEGHGCFSRLIECPPAHEVGWRRRRRDSPREQGSQFRAAGERGPHGRVVRPEANVIGNEIRVLGLLRRKHPPHRVEVAEAMLPARGDEMPLAPFVPVVEQDHPPGERVLR